MAGVPIGTKHGGLAGFNTVDGYLEAMFRGFRIDILKPEDYQAMTQQSETLDGALLLPSLQNPFPWTSLLSAVCPPSFLGKLRSHRIAWGTRFVPAWGSLVIRAV